MLDFSSLKLTNMKGKRLQRVEDMLKSDPKISKLFLENKIARLEFLDGTFFYQQYDFIQIMGAGSFGLVFSAMDKKSKELCSIKLLNKRKMGESELESMRRETSALNELRHPNIVNLIGVRNYYAIWIG